VKDLQTGTRPCFEVKFAQAPALLQPSADDNFSAKSRLPLKNRFEVWRIGRELNPGRLLLSSRGIWSARASTKG